MKLLAMLLVSGTMMGAVVTSAPLEKAKDISTKNALFLSVDGVETCPAGYDMYVRRVKVDPKAQGDFESFLHVPQGAVIRDNDKNKFDPACFQVK